jgi:DNA replication protein DnaC
VGELRPIRPRREDNCHKEFLAELLDTECAEREKRRKQRMVKAANFPPPQTPDFDLAANPNIEPPMPRHPGRGPFRSAPGFRCA